MKQLQPTYDQAKAAHDYAEYSAKAALKAAYDYADACVWGEYWRAIVTKRPDDFDSRDALLAKYARKRDRAWRVYESASAGSGS